MNNPAALRYAKFVSALPSHPGHHLGTVSFSTGPYSIVNWLIEGPWNDEITGLVMITDFSKPVPAVSYDGYRLGGTLLQRMRQMQFSPHTGSTGFELQLSNAVFPHLKGTIVFSGLRGADGVFPDSAVMNIDASTAYFRIALTDLKRGFNPILVALKVGVALGLTGCTSNETHVHAEAGSTVTVINEQGQPKVKADADLTVTEPHTGINAHLKGGVSSGQEQGGSTAPVPSSSGGVAPVPSGTATGHP